MHLAAMGLSQNTIPYIDCIKTVKLLDKTKTYIIGLNYGQTYIIGVYCYCSITTSQGLLYPHHIEAFSEFIEKAIEKIL